MEKSAVDGLIGNTPLVRLTEIEKAFGLQAKLYAKVERTNPGGSIKDRVAKAIIDDAERTGRLQAGGTIIEATSGNTGVGLAMIAAARGYKAMIVMPETMSVERRKLIAAYGAEIVLTDGAKGMQGSKERAEELAKIIPNSILAGQFDNPVCAEVHYRTTGPEIWSQTEGKTDVFVAGVGCGGTITGVGRYLKKQNPSVRVAAVEPASSPLLSKGVAGSHGIQGIGANFLPAILDTTIYDEVITVTDEEAIATARLLAKCEGLFVGISSGAAVAACILLAKRKENSGKNVVTVLPDDGGRYLSTALFE